MTKRRAHSPTSDHGQSELARTLEAFDDAIQKRNYDLALAVTEWIRSGQEHSAAAVDTVNDLARARSPEAAVADTFRSAALFGEKISGQLLLFAADLLQRRIPKHRRKVPADRKRAESIAFLAVLDELRSTHGFGSNANKKIAVELFERLQIGNGNWESIKQAQQRALRLVPGWRRNRTPSSDK